MTPGDPAAVDELAAVYLVRGDDAGVVGQSAHDLINRLVGDRDAALVVEEHGAPGAEELDVGAVVDAATTPPFLVDRRVVVVRDAGRLNAADGKRILTALEAALPSTTLVLVSGGGTLPQALSKEISARGQVVNASVGTGRDRDRWLSNRIAAAPVRLDRGAAGLVAQHLGEDVSRLAGLLATLEATYGTGSTVSRDQLAPFLGEAGSVPPWDLTDAIDRGDPATALEVLGRMTGPGGRAGPEVLAILHRHFSNMLVVEGLETRSGEEAARVIGTRSSFVGKKALDQSRRLGVERLGEAIGLLAAADLDIKGATALPPGVVLEVLVARLSRLTAARGARRPARR